MRRVLGTTLWVTAVLVATALPASAVPVSATATEAATAMARDAAFVAAASFQTGPPNANTTAVSDVSLASFPVHGTTFTILSSGNATQAGSAPQSNFASTGYSSSPRSPGGSDQDVTVLQVDLNVPAGKNCLSVDFRFLSEEFPEYVGSGYNDAFIAELDSTTWTTSGSTITAPNNFAFDPSGNVISINSSGVANMTAAEASGTIYDGSTSPLRAATPVTPGSHSVYLTIFDQGDSAYDSAVFLDNLALGTTSAGGCQPGASLPPPTVSKAVDSPTSIPGGANGYTITVTNPNDVAVSIDSISDILPSGFSYTPGSTTGAVTEDPSIAGQTLTWEAFEGSLAGVPATGGISLHFGVTAANTPGEYFNEAGATASGFAIDLTGPTAPVTVAALPEVLPCDPVTLEGTGAGETLLGGDGTDRIRGLAGRDRIDVLAGDDEACGGLGGDYLYGRDGIDTLRGEEGNDRLYGGRHGDVMEGEAGHDAFLGGRGDDTILAADGTKDCIVTGRGDDIVAADPGLDLVDPAKGCPAGFWL